MKDNRKKHNLPDKPVKENSYISRLTFETGIRLTGPEPLAEIDYCEELRFKDRAFSTYWYETGGACPASPVVASPLQRNYRTTTKRKIHKKGRSIILSSDEYSVNDKPSRLEPDFHSSIYLELGSLLSDEKNMRIAGFLNFIILRGNYDSAAVIFNVRVLNGETINGITKIAEQLRESFDKLDAAFIYHDPEGSKYYLNTSSEIEGPRMKRLFGNRNLSIKVNDIIYTFAPEGFSQVNLSICPEMLNTAKRLLKHEGKGRLLDLYCGYGFFSCFLSGDYEEIIGIDYGDAAVDSARENMKRVKTRAKWEFYARRIDRKTLPALLTQGRYPEYLILDPPRNGTAQGVVETLAARNPELVLHVFCGLETIPYELEKWKRGGYFPSECIPLDMFPGTPDLEVMILFEKRTATRRN